MTTNISQLDVMSEDLHKGAPPRHFAYGRENRKVSTDAERILWEVLRDRKFYGFKFRRQHPIHDFIADFYCHECKLIIELDGDYHNSTEQQQYDKGRTYELNELKITVIRFTNKEVIEDMEFIKNEIGKFLLEHTYKIMRSDDT